MFIEYRALSWWYWLVIVAFLTTGVSGWATGFLFAIGLAAFQLIHFAIRERSISAFPIQVRFGYWLVLLLFLVAPDDLRWLFWLPTIGTWATVLFGYCPMARIVSLLSWNRKQPLSLTVLKRTLLSAPVRGSILFPTA